VLTNEIDQFTDDPDQTTAVMGKVVKVSLPMAVWFGLDGPKARGLVNPDGSLRPTGEAFKPFIETNFRGDDCRSAGSKHCVPVRRKQPET